MNYPIDNDNLMDLIRNQIDLQKKCFKLGKRHTHLVAEKKLTY